MIKKERQTPEINSSSMADIAFLLLIFFLVTTTIANDKGLFLLLPPDPDQLEDMDIKIPEKNLFKIQINSADKLLVENEPLADVMLLKDMIKEFIMNNGRDPLSSDNPQKAIVSLKTDRGTTQLRFIEVLDQVKGAYHDIYAERAGVSNQRWRELSEDRTGDPEARRLYDIGRGLLPDGKPEIPMNISIAEPTQIGG
ncbi:MAG: biopolymer transporter ExbD [Cyclobacteriaceae bacterium]|nr:biopolymer transporter ExbD [Cyclobacteriaceae bacterium]